MNLPDLLPFPRSHVALQRTVSNIDRTRSVLGRRIAIENPSHYLRIDGHEWDEIEFLNELTRRTGCGLLLDVNNVHVSSRNLGFDRSLTWTALRVKASWKSTLPATVQTLRWATRC